jgi:hypothetical protein
MAQLLENQAAQVLKESNSLSTGAGNVASSGQVQGFSNIAFPIVRRVFGGLVANELVSIQPMSLPSGLIFYLDYTYGSNVGGNAGVGLSSSATAETYQRGQSIYNNPTGRGIQSGSLATGGMYDLVNVGYSRVQTNYESLSGSNDAVGAFSGPNEGFLTGSTVSVSTDFSGTNARCINFDPQIDVDLQSSVLDLCFVHIPVASIQAGIAERRLPRSRTDQPSTASKATAAPSSGPTQLPERQGRPQPAPAQQAR